MKPKCTDDRELQRILQSMDEKNAPSGGQIDLARWKKWFWLVLVLGGLALGWHWFGGGDEQKLRRAFSQLGSVVSKSGGTVSQLAILGTQDDLSKLFADPVTLQVSGEEDYGLDGTYSRAEVNSNLARLRQVCKTLQISFSDIRIRSRNSSTASVDATVRATATFEDGKAEEVRLLSCQLVKEDGRWRFKSFIERQVLDKGRPGTTRKR